MQKTIHLYNTLTRQKEEFVPRHEGEVSIYVCGVTPYDDAHMGHARPSIFFDVVRRFFRHAGYRVKLIQNFTDVDDKIIERARSKAVEPLRLAHSFAQRYLESMDRLGVERADNYPMVSEHIDDIVQMVQGLIDNGAAYESDGSVFFRVDAFPDYGKLSKQRKEELIAGARVEAGEAKENPLDFALWKAAKEGEPAWESPWGPGRPGWHIECSAMSIKYLGSGFDIHGGGLDLVFPHHENEIAQAEACTLEAPFVRYWMHNGLVNFGDEKMSKSLGNFVTIDQVLETYPAEFIRYAILQHHYRSPIEFSAEQMESMRRGWERLGRSARELASFGDPLDIADAESMNGDETLLESVKAAREKFDTAMADDFNSPAAFASLFELIRDVRSVAGRGENVTKAERISLRAAQQTVQELAGDMFGILSAGDEDGADGSANGKSDALVEELVTLVLEMREEARKQREFETADRLRDRLGEMGIVLEDTAEGTRWSFKA